MLCGLFGGDVTAVGCIRLGRSIPFNVWLKY